MSELKYILAETAIIAVLIFGFLYAKYRYNVWANPETRVYVDDKLVYEGNAHFYTTESRGTATILKIRTPKFLFPKKTLEVMSNNIRIEPKK